MTDQALGDVIDGERYSVAELRKMIFEGQGELSRPLALSLLDRKSYPQKVKDLERLLADNAETPRLRAMAAVSLGRAGTPAAVEALKRSLATREPTVLRGVVRGLSMAGGEDARSALEGLKRRKGSVGETAKFAATLLGHQASTRGSKIGPQERGSLEVDVRRAVPMKIAPAQRDETEEVLARVSKATPALRLTAENAISIECEDRRFMFLFGESSKEGVGYFTQQKAEAGIVARRNELEGVGWEVKYHVLTQPREDGQVDLAVVTSRGRLMLVGSARIKNELAEFEIRSVEGAGVLPIAVSGTYDGQTLSVREARSNRRRSPSPAPSPLRPA